MILGDAMKKILTSITVIVIVLAILFTNQDFTTFVLKNTIYKQEMAIQTPNQYEVKTKFQFVKEVPQKEPQNKEELFNLFYTILNGGFEEYTFFCPSTYKTCIEDTKQITENQLVLSNLNNFVHPYNSYNKIAVNMNSFGRVNVKIDKLYSKEQREKVDQEIDRIMNEIITDQMTPREKILAFHDYIINTTVYDKNAAASIKNGLQTDKGSLSHFAYGTLFQHLSLCGGYSDTMAIFLTKIGIPNMKIANDEHVWNLVYLDNSWLHLDLTWDDPVVDTGQNLLLHNFFLITTKDLQQKDNVYHNFDPEIYVEATYN